MFVRIELWRYFVVDIVREPGSGPQKSVHTQIAVGTRVASYHDEIKLSMPAIWTPSYHLLLTFLHVDLQTKLEAPKPVRSP